MYKNSFMDYTDYYVSISDGDYTEEVIVNFTYHSTNRSLQRDVDIQSILHSLEEKEMSQILDLHNYERAAIIDYNQSISYIIELYLEKRKDEGQIILNIITVYNGVNIATNSKQKKIYIGKNKIA